MSHYFIEDNTLPNKPKYVSYHFGGVDFVFETDSGLFSKDHIDPASDILIRALPTLSGSLLDWAVAQLHRHCAGKGLFALAHSRGSTKAGKADPEKLHGNGCRVSGCKIRLL